MKKHFITTLMLLIACVLSSCAEEQAAQKASVDLKATATTHAANVKTAAPKSATAAKEPDAVKEAAASAKGAAKASVAPAANAAKTPATPTANAAKTPAAPPKPGTNAPSVSGQVPDAPAAKGATKVPATAAQTAAKMGDPPPALSVPQGYRYEPRGRRDPFIQPIPKQPRVGEETPAPVVRRPDGLPGALVSEVRLSGIVHSSDKTMNKAMLVVGKNTYFAKKGDSLFDGVIKEIRPSEVVFSMVSATTRKPINRDTVVRTGASSGTSAGEKK
jgi:hypothetical protein